MFRPSLSSLVFLLLWTSAHAEHWSFEAPRRPPLPAVQDRSWPLNPLDHFVLAALESDGLQPAPPAEPLQLLTRVTLDLTGLPPTVAEVDAFARDRRPDAYERAVERLLASPRFGEQRALFWLDLARYADTHGYHVDSQREMWRWRDGVIEAFNRNQSFAQFTVEQLAGDLLPSATLEQRVASGFHRNTMINFENGALADEYLAEYVHDRVATTATVWLGLTLHCARCHDHKYDPFTTRDYYQFFAYFNNVPEKGLDGEQGNAVPRLAVPTALQQQALQQLDRRLAQCQREQEARAQAAAADQAAWERRLVAGESSAPPPGDMSCHFSFDEAQERRATNGIPGEPEARVVGQGVWIPGRFGQGLLFDGETHLLIEGLPEVDREDRFTFSFWCYPTTQDRMSIVHRIEESAGEERGLLLGLEEGQVYAQLARQAGSNALRVRSRSALALRRWQHVAWTYDGSGRARGMSLFIDGVKQECEIVLDKLTESIRAAVPLRVGDPGSSFPFRGILDELRIYPRDLADSEISMLAGGNPLREAAALAAERRTPQQQAALQKFYLEEVDEAYQRLAQRAAELRREQAALQKLVPTTMVMAEQQPRRPTHILLRGQYNELGEPVKAGTPAALPALSPGARDRLALARWLVHPQQPLTPRVTVNHFWEQCFGRGLVRTSEDFGTQGELPSHPELLDWLATEFVASGWDVKHVWRLMVRSNTYRQASRVTAEQFEADPDNRRLARGSRFRLPAEMIRDRALMVSGLLDGRIGGPSVKPYQPPGLWEEVSYDPDKYTAQTFTQGQGSDLYRRSMYTFWKRSVPPPNLALFDAPEREVCVVRRSRTNTPQQALVLLNDPTFVEAGRAFAQRILREGGADIDSRIRFAFRAALGRAPSDEERAVVRRAYATQRERLRREPDRAAAFLQVGEFRVSSPWDSTELAAWSLVAQLILALSETITRG